jgi:hypothetical protein
LTKKNLSTLKERTKRTFRSKFEESIASNLTKRKVLYDYESIDISYTTIRKYKPDFILSNGIIIEAKGYFRSADQRKHKLIKEQHPDLDIRFVFQKSSSRVQGSKMTCAQWCDVYNFKYSETYIPKDWVDELTLTTKGTHDRKVCSAT